MKNFRLRKRSLPYLYTEFDISWIRIHTEVMHKAQDCFEFRYIALHLKVFKWKWSFQLYSPEYAKKYKQVHTLRVNSAEFHRLWTMCVDTPNYNKEAWKAVEEQLINADKI